LDVTPGAARLFGGDSTAWRCRLTFFKLHGFAFSGKGAAPRELSHGSRVSPDIAPAARALY
jgi:hypothetical protein